MSERYRPRELKRAAAKLWADPNYPSTIERRREQDIADRLDVRQREKLRGAPVVVECRHGVPWLRCNLCSKPRKPA